jgi:hypothetical protein
LSSISAHEELPNHADVIALFFFLILSLCLDFETHLHNVNTGSHMHTNYESNVLTSAGGQEAGAHKILVNICHDFYTHHISVYIFTT